jgi:hypothetical protein
MRPLGHFCCQNPTCPDHGRRAEGNLSFRGWPGRNRRTRTVYCRTGKKSFSRRKGTPPEGGRLPEDEAVSLPEHPREGCGTRATSRPVGVDRNTGTRYARLAGRHAHQLHHEGVAFSPRDP